MATLNVADKETLDLVTSNVGNTDDTDGSLNSGTLMAKSNKILETTENVTDKMGALLTLMGSGMAEYTKAGTYTLEIPAGITKLTITACAGGGAGCGAFVHAVGEFDFGSGGSGGECIIEQEYTIPSSTTVTPLTITVGAGGKAKTSINGTGTSRLVGGDGGATIIGNLVTLAGGKAGANIGTTKTMKTIFNSSTTASVGTGSGTGGASQGEMGGSVGNGIFGAAGGDGSTGKGGSQSSIYNTNSISVMAVAGGAGGGSLGDGGSGACYDNTTRTRVATAGIRGGGGAAASGRAVFDYDSSNSNGIKGTNGGDGYVKIVWGL